MLTDWMNEWRTLWVLACFMLARVRTIEIGLISMVHTPSSPITERKKEREKVREKERDREWDRKRERERERERERCRICPELLFLFLKGMTGDQAHFSYLVILILA